MSVTVNVYSSLVLAVLLLPKLKETGKMFGTLPHLVHVGIVYAFQYELDTVQLREGGVQSLDVEKDAVMANRYAVSNMVGMFAAFDLARLIGQSSSTDVIVNVVFPGLVRSNLLSNLKNGYIEFLNHLYATYGKEAEPASRAYLHAMDAGRGSHGLFVKDCQVQKEALPEWWTNNTEGQELQKLLWDGVAKELESVVPGALEKAL